MGYFGFGQLTGLNNNPYLYGSNPFASYSNPFSSYSNPFGNYGFGSSIFQNNYGLNSFGLYPNLSEYNFLNNPTNYSIQNFGTGSFNSGFGTGNFSGIGSLNGYNFLNSNPVSYPQVQNFATFNTSDFTTNPYAQFTNFSTGFQPAQETEVQEEQTPKTKSVKEKTLQNRSGYGAEFLAKVKKIANKLNCNYKDLLAVMNAESGISTTAVNKSTNATGLIQFIPDTARGLGTTVEQLKKMTPIQQLNYVEKYLAQTKKQAGFSTDKKLSGGELYALVFRPAKVKTGIFATRGEKAYTLNAPLDLNKDGKITMSELSKRVENFYVSDKSFIA